MYDYRLSENTDFSKVTFICTVMQHNNMAAAWNKCIEGRAISEKGVGKDLEGGQI
jgi:hypothetical protein